jgi:hypothetical protein
MHDVLPGLPFRGFWLWLRVFVSSVGLLVALWALFFLVVCLYLFGVYSVLGVFYTYKKTAPGLLRGRFWGLC